MQQINAASGKVEKILGPNSHFSVVEMLLSKLTQCMKKTQRKADF